MKLATETITLFHNDFNPETGGDAWSRAVIRGVSFHGDTATTITDTGLTGASRFTIRIPTTDELIVEAGDIIAKGESDAENPTGLAGTITVVGVTDNRRGRGGHWKIAGK